MNPFSLRRLARLALCCAVFLATNALRSAPADARLLVDFKTSLPEQRVRVQDARLEWGSSQTGLRVQLGHEQTWPGLTVTAPTEGWDLSPFAEVTVELRNLGAQPVKVFARVDNDGADGKDHCVTGSVEVPAGQRRALHVPLTRYREDQLGQRLFGMRGYPVAAGGSGTLDPARITQCLVFLHQPKQDHALELLEIRASGRYVPPTAWVNDAEPYFPMIDPLGQYRHKTWPGKTASVDALATQREAEAVRLRADPGPQDWTRFGGWKSGPQLTASGFFRTEKRAGRWWFVDPEGRLFFSHGVDCVRMLDATAIEEREAWFEGAPWQQPDLAEFLFPAYALKGHYAGRTVRSFSYAGANLKRKYGANWRRDTLDTVHRRLRHWGFNTIGMWSDAALHRGGQTVYVDSIGSHDARLIEGSEGYWGKFPDVFDPSFAANLRRAMERHRGQSAGDPWCLGYFADNELSWGDEFSLGRAALASPAGQPAKTVFLEDLRQRYEEVSALNQAWGTDYPSWDALREAVKAPAGEGARPDLERFYTRAAEAYFRGVRDAIKAVAPQQLYLGCRFAWGNPRAAAAAAKFCDVVSFNLYQRSVADFAFPGGADAPVLIGEFHFGALDRGLFHTGLVATANQDERALAYRDYVRGALSHPQIVGCHWFQYQDEPTTGRVYDEENYQIGVVDIADTPYAEFVAASRAMGEALYRRR